MILYGKGGTMREQAGLQVVELAGFVRAINLPHSGDCDDRLWKQGTFLHFGAPSVEVVRGLSTNAGERRIHQEFLGGVDNMGVNVHFGVTELVTPLGRSTRPSAVLFLFALPCLHGFSVGCGLIQYPHGEYVRRSKAVTSTRQSYFKAANSNTLGALL